MKEFIVKIPDESSDFVTQLLEKLGAEITHKKTIQKKHCWYMAFRIKRNQ